MEGIRVMAKANRTPPASVNSAAYEYPTPAMVAAYVNGVNGMPGSATPLASYNTSSLGAPAIGGPMTTQGATSWRQRLAVFILGADAGSILFPPQQPLQPIAQPLAYGSIGRQWDYPVGYNTRVPPRSGLPVNFGTLKKLADEYDVLRIMIERVKDKVNAQDWSIGMRDEKLPRDATCDEIEDFFQYPDKLHPWDDWLRMLLEQVIVYDAPAVWLRPTRGGELYSLEIIDGALVSPKIMADGRLPPPEYGPAYQQVLKGLPAVDYIQPVPTGSPIPLDPTGQPFPELYYRPRNIRVDSVYGFSPVEQIIRTIQIGIAQEDWLRDYFQFGATPDLLLGVPENWNPGQIQQMQDFFDSMLVGNLANRRGARFIPGGIKPVDTKEKALMDASVQEWLVRVMCFALGLNPMPFVKMMNKGQEKTHHDESKEEGLRPWLEWVANFVNVLIALKWGRRDVVFRWAEEDDTDPKTMAEIDQILISTGMYLPDERRVARGDAPMDAGKRKELDQREVAAATAIAEVKAGSKAKENEGKPTAKEKSAEKAAEVAALLKAITPGAPTINVAAPNITMPAITMPAIKVDAPTINLPAYPEMKMGDTFVEVGPTTVRVDAPKGAGIGKTVTAERTPEGAFVGTITDGVTRKVRAELDADGRVITKAID